MSHDEQAVREVIQRWIDAVAASDLEGVLATHTADVVMFDVPPPDDGIRGIDAYRAAWPPFLEWQQGDGCFELVRLDVTAGTDVAFAHALLRCGTPESLQANPGRRLRVSLGLRKDDGRWLIAHEHHSFPLA
jgi:uncharacterized protein (TIGR02246 family)